MIFFLTNKSKRLYSKLTNHKIVFLKWLVCKHTIILSDFHLYNPD